jgi:hypothetical protein
MGPELTLEELEQEDVELLPDREEMSLVNVNGDFHANGILNGSFHYNHTVNDVDIL